MGVSNSNYMQDEDDVMGMEYIRGRGVLTSIPDEVKPRPKIGRNQKSSKSQGKIKNESLRSALSIDLENPDVERIRKEFDMFKLNKENELANVKRKEKKLETENKKLKTELQALQKTCKKLRDERDYALDAEQRALMRAAAIENDRDKIQRQFKIFRETKETELQNLLKVKRNLESKLMKLDPSQLENGFTSSRDDDTTDGWTAVDSVVGLYPAYGHHHHDHHLHHHHHHHQDDMLDISFSKQEGPFAFNSGPSLNHYSNVVTVFWLSSKNIKDCDTSYLETTRIVKKCCSQKYHILNLFHISFEEINQKNLELFISEVSKMTKNCFLTIIIINNFDPSNSLQLNLLEKLAACDCYVEAFIIATNKNNCVKDCQKLIKKRRARDFSSFIFTTPEELSLKVETIIEKRLREKTMKYELDCLAYLGWGNTWVWQNLQERMYQECLSRFNPPHSSHHHHHHRYHSFSWFEKYIDRINSHISSAGPLPPILIDGSEASGKTTLLMKWIDQYRERSPSSFVLFYSVHHPSHPSCDLIIIIKCLMFQIMQCLFTPFALVYDSNQLIRDFPKWLEKVSVLFSGGVVLVIDSIDFVQNFENSFDWLMDPLPVDLHIIISTRTNACPSSWRSWPYISIDPMTENEVKQYVDLLANETSSFDKEVTLTYLLDNPVFCLPLPISLSVSLSMSGSKGTELSSCANLHDLYTSILKHLEGRKEDGMNEDFQTIKMILELIRSSRNGLSLSELMDMVGKENNMDWMRWVEVIKLMTTFKLAKFSDGLIVLHNSHVGTALDNWLNRCVTIKDSCNDGLVLMKTIRDYRLQHSNDCTLDEIAWVSEKCNDKDFLLQFISDVKVCVTFLDRGLNTELINYWNSCNVDLSILSSSLYKQLHTYQQKLEESGDEEMSRNEVAHAYEHIGKFFANHGLHDEALILLQKCIEIYEFDLELGSLKIGHVTNLLGQIHEKLGRRSAAETLYLQALGLFESLPDSFKNFDGDEQETTITGEGSKDDGPKILTNGKVNDDGCNGENRESGDEEEPAGGGGGGGSNHQNGNIEDMDDGDESNRPHHRRVPVHQRYHYHHLIAAQLDLLAGLHQKQGRVEMSDNFSRKAGHLRKKSSKPMVTDTNIGTTISQGSKINKEIIKQRIENLQELCRSGQLDTLSLANVEQELGMLSMFVCNFRESESLLIGSLDKYESMLPSDNPHVIQSLNGLVALYSQLKQFHKVDEMSERMLNTLQKGTNQNTALLIAVLRNLVAISRSIGRVDKTEAYLELILSTAKQSSSSSPEDVATALVNLAVFYSQQGRYSKAEPLYQKALNTYRSVLSPNHPRILETTKNLALLKYEQGEFETAAQLYMLTMQGNQSKSS